MATPRHDSMKQLSEQNRHDIQETMNPYTHTYQARGGRARRKSYCKFVPVPTVGAGDDASGKRCARPRVGQREVYSIAFLEVGRLPQQNKHRQSNETSQSHGCTPLWNALTCAINNVFQLQGHRVTQSEVHLATLLRNDICHTKKKKVSHQCGDVL